MMKVFIKSCAYLFFSVVLIYLIIFTPNFLKVVRGKHSIPTAVEGVHHLGGFYAVSEFYMDRRYYSNIWRSGIGGEMCCVALPAKWRSDLTVEVRWSVIEWRADDQGKDNAKRTLEGIYKARVPVEKYDSVGDLCVHFFPHGKVRVLSGNCRKQFPEGVYEDDSATQGEVMPDDSNTNSPLGPIFTKQEYKKMVGKVPWDE